MQIDILSLFPNMFEGPFSQSILSRAQKKELLTITVHDIRAYSTDKHQTTDDRPYGGGPGMVMMIEPIDRALKAVKISGKTHKTILMAASGTPFTHQKAKALSAIDQLIIIAGHYEGVDQRVEEYLIDETISIGPYVLTGGELPAMVITDAIARLIPGVLGNETSLNQESHSLPGVLEYPHYTRPEEYKGWKVPDILLSGNHAAIEKWRQQKSKNQ